ncbi:MAG: preprotein translocase subunit SecE [Candidatus Kapabacteria bacterium]|nr:preprotein translocase subunit SecE [Candidatus Kapabacteria bacterium]
MVAQLKSFFSDVSKEMKKVSWSTREQLQESTIVVAVTCVIISVFVMLIDLGMTQIVKFLFKS